MGDFIAFKKFITPAFMQVIFWILVAANTIFALMSIIRGADAPYGAGMLIVGGLLSLFLGPIFIRVICEVTIVMFRIHDSLEAIRGNRQQM